MRKSEHSASSLAADKVQYRLLIWPAFFVLFVLTVAPLFLNLLLSFTNTTITTMNKFKFVGLDNFVYIFTKDRYFWSSCLVMLKLVAGTVSMQIIFGMLVALLWYREFPGVRMCRLLHLVPMMIMGIVAGFIWRMLLNADMGLINHLLSTVGVKGPNWLGDERWALVSVIITNLWVGTPFVTIILLSALQGVDESYIEASTIDGAGQLRIFFQIILPLIRPAFLLATMFRLMDAIRQFDLIDALTSGGPGNATQQLNLYTYQVGFAQWRLGYGAALSLIILAIILSISLTFMHLINKSSTD